MLKPVVSFLKLRKLIKTRKNFIKIFILALTLIWFTSSGFLYFERPTNPNLSWGDGLWWSVVTMTTVGYGDFYPVTFGGRYLVGIPAMLLGIGLLGFFISELSSAMIEYHTRRLKGMNTIFSKDHILIINFESLEKILTLVKELKADPITKDKDICLIDEFLEELPEELIDQNITFIKGNPTRKEILSKANISDASHAIILLKNAGDSHSDDQNLSTLLVIESINPNIVSIVEVFNPEKEEQFKLAGCDISICAADLSVNLIVQELQDSGTKDVIWEITSNQYGEQIYFVKPISKHPISYKDVVVWCLENNYTALGISREGKTIINCSGETPIKVDDKLILIGNKRIREIFF